MANKLKAVLDDHKSNKPKYKDCLIILAFCDEKNKLFNFIKHQNNYLQKQYRKYNIQIMYPKITNKVNINELGLYSFPSYVLLRNGFINKYNGTDILQIEKLICNLSN